MKTEATKFFQEYFNIHDDEIELYEETIDCMVQFANKVNHSKINNDVQQLDNETDAMLVAALI